MDPLSTALFVYGLPLMDKIIDAAVSYGYNKLKSNTTFFKILRDLELDFPKDDSQSLYLHSVFAFAANGKHRELIKLMLLKSSNEAFYKEIKHFEQGAFKLELDHALHVNSIVSEIKNWNEIPQTEIEEFFAIYRGFTLDVAAPSQSMLMDMMRQINDQIKESRDFSQNQFSAVKSSLEQTNVRLATADSNNPLQKEYDRQLNVISKAISQSKFNDSLSHLRGLKTAIWENADSSIRFKLLTNIGFCLFELGKDEEAAQVLIEAYEFSPDSEIALSNMINAYYILDDRIQAQNYLKIAIEKFGSTSESTWTNYVTISPVERSMEDVISELPAAFKDKPLVLLSIGLGYRKRDDASTSLEYVQRAYNLTPEDDTIADHYIKLRLERYNYDFKILNQRILNSEQIADLTNLIELLDKRYEAIKDTDLKEDIVFVLMSKSYLLNLLGQSDSAHHFIDQALFIDPFDPFALRQKALIFASNGSDSKLVIEQLLKIPNIDDIPGGRLLLAEAHMHAGNNKEAIKTFESIIEDNDDVFWVKQAKEILVSLYIKEGLGDKLSSIKNKGFDQKDIPDGICYARILEFEGKRDEAKGLLLELFAQVNEDCRYKEILFLAEELEKSGLLPEAVQLYDMIVEKDVDSYLSEKLYKLSYRIGEKAKALSVLEKLREKNGPLKRATKDEITIYQEYSDYNKARELAELYLKKYPDDLAMKLTLIGLHIRLENYLEADKLLGQEYDYLSLSHNELSAYIRQLLARQREEKAVEIAYEYRRAKNDVRSNDVYMMTFLEYPSTAKPFVISGRVTKHSVVTLSNRTAPKYILIVEDKPDSELISGEISLVSPEFMKLQGKQVGEKVILDDRYKKEWEITEINHRYFHAFRDAQEKSNTIFQGQSDLQTFHVSDFWDVIGQLVNKDWGKKYEEIMTFYLKKRIGIGFLSEQLNRNPINLWNELSLNPERGIQTAFGNTEDMQNALKLLNEKKSILCADITGLLAMFEMEIGDLIESQFGKILIVPTTEDLIHDYKDEILRFSQTGLIPNRFQNFIDFVKKHTSVRIPNTIKMNSLKKMEIDSILGKSFFDTILLAEEQGGFVCSEDCITKLLAKNEHQVEGLWTQPILVHLTLNGVISQVEYEQKVIKLVQQNIRHTSISHLTLKVALEMSSKFYEEPFTIVAKTLQGKMTSTQSAFVVCMRFLMDVWSDTSINQRLKVDISIRIFEVLSTDREVFAVIRVVERFLKLVGDSSESNSRAWACYHISNSLNEFRHLYKI